MSVIDLRKEFVKLQKEFVGGRVTKLKKHEVEHRLSVLKQAMSLKSDVAAPEPARTGPPAARDILTKDVTIDDDTVIKKPMKPEGPDPVVKKPRGLKKVTVAEPVEVPKLEVKPVEKTEKPKRVPPKVVFDESEISAPTERKFVKKPKSKATGEPKTAPPAPEAEPKEMIPPVVPPVIKLPGGVRKLE